MRKLTPLFALAYLAIPSPLWANTDSPVQTYISQYKDIAVSEMKRTGIPASITLAQAIVESKYGTSTLATSSNNHFGIKCKSNWEGKRYYFKDDDYQNGRLVPSCFRSYEDPVQSYYDHSDFLLENNRYQPLFLLERTDYRGWALGLKKCGYATASHYAYSLIEAIEKYQLYQHDQTISIIQDAYVLSMPVQREEIVYTSSTLTPPKAVRLPLHYRIRQGNTATRSIPSARTKSKKATPYLFEIIPNVRREDVE